MDEEHPFKPGTVKSIKVVNFMCHDSFEIALGPRVNFIIGPNGSGKSALLTALVVALGGRATVTQRAKKVADFIKTGKRSAEITIVIHNYAKVMEKDKAFKPDDYGKEIIVHKVISRDDSSKLALRSDKNKKVSERKAELDEMLEHFGILINNPICILNQEVSKTFLHSKKPEDKFELFMKATNLEQITNDYDQAGTDHMEWEECNKSKSTSFKLLESEYNSCKEKSSFLENRAKLNDMRESLNRELIWAITRDNEEYAKNLELKSREMTKKIEEQEKIIQDKEKKVKTSEQEIEVSKAKVESNQKDVEQAKESLRDIKDKETIEKTKQADVSMIVGRLKRSIERIKSDNSSLEKDIAKMKQELDEQNNLDHDVERRKLELERLEREIPADLAKEKTIRQHSKQLDASMLNTREELQSCHFKLNTLRTKQASGHAHLKRLKNGQEDSLRKYGDNVLKVRQGIEEAHARGKFQKKPIGPLGYHLKLMNPDMAPALEIHLGRNAHAFICDNSQDMAALNTIIKNVYSREPGARQPLVISRKFASRHRTDRFRARHPHYKTFLDCLQIEDDCVHNALVDRCFLESILFIPDFYEAEQLLINPSSVPLNTRLAYTKDCYAIHPNINDNNYKCFHNDPSRCMLFKDNNMTQIREYERELGILGTEIRDVEKIFGDIKKSYDDQKREKESNDQEIKRILDIVRSKEEQLLTLKTTVIKEPQELSALEEELETNIAKIAKENLELDKELETLKQIDEDLGNIASKRKIREEKLRKLEASSSQEYKVIDSQNLTIRTFKKHIKDAQTAIENLKKEQASTIQELEQALEKVARSKLNIPQGVEPPNQVRQTDVIKEDLRKVDAQLRVDIEEMQDPEEMKASLLKRMKEIESLTELKELNLSNHASMKKLLEERGEGLNNLRQSTVSSVSTTFASVMRSMKMTGELHIHLDDVIDKGEVVKKARTLDIRVDTNYAPSQRTTQVMNETNNNQRSFRSQPPRKRPCRESDGGKENDIRMTDTRSLSGGERSFSTVAFVLALWHHCASPFKLMDEIDVFMDMVTRRVSYNALIRYAQLSSDPGQFIFFSPLELPKFDDSGTYVRVYEMPSIVRKQPATTQE